MRHWVVVVAVALLAVPTFADVVDFEDLGSPFNNTVASFSSGGFDFTPGPLTNTFNHLHVGLVLGLVPLNGTTVLGPHGDVIMELSGGGLFDAFSVDLGANPNGTIHVIGKYADDSTVTYFAAVGGGSFSTFNLPGSFTGLKELRFLVNGTGSFVGVNIQGGFSIDNINVPEPASLSLLVVMAAGLAWRRRRPA